MQIDAIRSDGGLTFRQRDVIDQFLSQLKSANGTIFMPMTAGSTRKPDR
jgi:hypothetical protein